MGNEIEELKQVVAQLQKKVGQLTGTSSEIMPCGRTEADGFRPRGRAQIAIHIRLLP